MAKKPTAPLRTSARLLRSMLLSAASRSACAEAYALGKIGGFCHLYIGQEARRRRRHLRRSATTTTSSRAIATTGRRSRRGITPRAIMAELFGRVDGCARGKGGSMHLFDRNVNFLGGHGIVGGHIPLATGVGFAIKYRGGDQVCVCFFGEAAVNNGAFHEALNMAALWKLPVIYHHREQPLRHGHGARARVARWRRSPRARTRTTCRNEVVDGQDVMIVREATMRAVERARKETTPTLLEVQTYRFMGHSMSDAVSGTYRTKEELDARLKRDPIMVLRRDMASEGEWSDAALAKLEEEIKQIVEDAWQFADASPEPPLEALWEDILVDTTSDTGASAPVPG